MADLDTAGAAPPSITILGEQIALGPLQRDLLPLYQRWYNDFGTTRNLRASAPLTAEALAADYERMAVDEGRIGFTIYRRDTWQPIGTTGWNDLDWLHRTAEFVLIVGESAARGRGYGTEATRLMLDYAFTALGLHSVFLRVYAYNLAGLRIYQKAGFREVGRRRECHQMGGRFWDAIIMDCLARDFTSPVLHTIFQPDQPRERGATDEQ